MHRVVNGTQKGWASLMAEMYREITSPDTVLSEEPMYSEDTEHGKAYEDAARAHAEFELGVDIVQVGFARHHLHKWLGASVDGLILKDDDAGIRREIDRVFSGVFRKEQITDILGYVEATVEIKCFTNLQNHAYVWTNRRVLDRYVPQVMTQNLVFEAPRSFFVSYHEGMPERRARVAIVEMGPDQQYQQMLLGRAQKFMADFELYRANGGAMPLLSSTIPKRF